MGARLKYAKVVDRDLLMRTGATIKPGLDNRVELTGSAPAVAAGFTVVRNWYNVDGPFTESWRLVDPHGQTVHQGLDHEVLTGNQDVVDEIDEQRFEYADSGYQLVLEIDGREVARADFDVVEPQGESR